MEKMKFIFMLIVSNLVKMLLLLMIYLLQVEQLKQLFNFVEQLGGKVVGIAFLIELEALKGREKLKDYNVYSVLTY